MPPMLQILNFEKFDLDLTGIYIIGPTIAYNTEKM